MGIALGKQCCGLLGNDAGWIELVEQAAEQTGERVWPLPLYEEYLEDLKSDCADLKNVANDSYGGTIRSAMFLKQFIRKDVLWAHLDIASMAHDLSHIAYYPKKGASGAYVRLIAQLILNF